MEIFRTLHSYWAYFALALLIITVIKTILNLKKDYTLQDIRLPLFTLIASHIQLFIGLAWYFSSPSFKSLKANGMGEIDSATRLLAVEHPIMMIIAIVFITIGFSKHKKQTTSAGKFKTLAIWYGLALAIILARIPWSNWF